MVTGDGRNKAKWPIVDCRDWCGEYSRPEFTPDHEAARAALDRHQADQADQADAGNPFFAPGGESIADQLTRDAATRRKGF